MEFCWLEASVAFGTEPVALRPAGLHGVVSLELDGHLPSTGVGPQLRYDAEVSAWSQS